MLEKAVPILVVALPLCALLWYGLYQAGLFHPAQQQVLPANGPTPQVSQSGAVITLQNPQQLPKTVAKGDFANFSFTIKNPGTIAATYPYKVSVTWNDGTQNVIDVNTVSLRAGESKTISESLKFETANAKAQITIETQNPAESVHFTLPHKS